jgi:hypothetical protein
VGVIIGVSVRWAKKQGSCTDGGRVLYFLRSLQTGPGVSLAFFRWGLRTFSLGMWQSGRKTYHIPFRTVVFIEREEQFYLSLLWIYVCVHYVGGLVGRMY